MEFTGERMIPEHNAQDLIYSEHIVRYNFASQFVQSKTVLDIASGSGYGTNILAYAGALSVTGADISDEAVNYANVNYGTDNLKFVQANGTSLIFEDNSFDVVVSFETIEHLEDYQSFYNELCRVLKDDGVLIISSPNKDVYPEGNDFHFKEFTLTEFEEILGDRFTNQKVYAQNNFLISSLFDVGGVVGDGKNEIVDNIQTDGMYFIAVCSNDTLPNFDLKNLISSPDEMASASIVQEREKHIEILKLDVEELQGQVDTLHSDIQQERDKSEYLYGTLQKDGERIDSLVSAIRDKEANLSKLIDEKADVEAQVNVLKDTFEQKVRDLDRAEAEVDRLQTEVDSLELTEQSLLEEKEKSEYLFRLVTEKEAMLDAAKTEKNDLNARCEKLNIKKEQLEKEHTALHEAYYELKSQTAIATHEIESLKKEKQTLEENNEKDLEQLKSDISQKSQRLYEVGTELTEAKMKLLHLQSQTDVKKEECTVSKLKVEVLEEKLANSSREVDALSSKLLLLEKVRDELQDQLVQKNASIEGLVARIEQDQGSINNLEQAIGENNNRIKEVEQTVVNVESKNRELNKEMSAKETSISLLNAKLEMTAQEVSDMQRSLSWRLTKPLRLAFDLLAFLIRPIRNLLRDFGYSLELLKREGLKSFVYRFFWYLRGKRLIEEIQYEKNKKYFELEASKANKKSIIHFDRVRNPKVSIIIPVYNQWDYTYNCLNSIYENTKGIEYEIIVADDVSSDETQDIKEYVKNIKVIRHKENLRFLLNCNVAAKEAKGEYVLFLNNDTYVHPGWLDNMLKIFDNYENVGATGAKLIYEDGRQQEAGGIIWDDASGWNFGRLGDPQQPEFNYVKEVDYISGACLMIPHKLWKELGGFDEHFVPAYYEDTDICFEIRKAGYKVMLQPHSVVTHFEGVSNGTDTSSGQKKYQVVNHKKFYEKWKQDLKAFHFKNAENVFLARDRSRNKQQVLVIDHYVPHYDKDAGSRSTFSYLKLLVKMGCNVKFIGDNFYKHEPYTSELEQLGIEVLYGNHYFNNISDWIKENGKYFDYVFAHRMHIAPKYFVDLKKYSNAKIIYIGHDLQFVKSKKEYEFSNEDEHLRNYEKFKEIETSIFNTVDIIYPFSTYEAPLIQEIVPNKVVRPIPVYFFEDEYNQQNGFNQRKDILFVGGFGHPPNVDAVLWFANEVFPIIQNEIPDVKFHVVGSKPTKEIEVLKSDAINVTGFISDEELAQYYEKCRLSVIPLRVGAGVKGKLLETMHFKLPAVITSVAAEGVPNVEKCNHVADEAKLFANKVVELYLNSDQWENFSERGSKLISDYYSMRNAEELLRMDLIKKK